MPARGSPAHKRFLQQADADPQAYEAHVRQTLGVPSAVAEKLLNLHGKLHHGGQLQPEDVALLARTYPYSKVPMDDVAAALNAEPPGGLRARKYLALLSGDIPVLFDRLHEAGSDYRGLESLSTAFHLESTVDELQRRRDGGTVKPEPPQRRQEDPHSVRSIIEGQMIPKGAREVAARIEAGDDATSRWFASRLADKAQAAIDVLGADDDADVSLRDTLDAAATFHEAEEIGKAEGYIDVPEDGG